MPSNTHDIGHVYFSNQFSKFKNQLCDVFLDCLGKRPFSASTKKKTRCLYIKDENFMGYDFYSSSFSFILNDTYVGQRVGIKTRWIPNILYTNAIHKTVVYAYYDVRDNAKYKVDHVSSMLFRGFSYSLFIQAAIDFRKLSTDLANEILRNHDIETEDFHICAIVARTHSRLPLTEAEFDGVASHHKAILNSRLLAKDFDIENILQDSSKCKIESVLFTKRFGETELQKLLREVRQYGD